MSQTTQIEVWVLIDQEGAYVVGKEAEGMQEKYDDEVGGTDIALRRVKVTLTVPLPKPIELTGVVPAEASEGELKAA